MKRVFKQVIGRYYLGGGSTIGVSDVVELRNKDADVRRLKICSTLRPHQMFVSNTLCENCCFFKSAPDGCPVQSEEVHRMNLPGGRTMTSYTHCHSLLCFKVRRKRDYLVWFEDMDNYLEDL